MSDEQLYYDALRHIEKDFLTSDQLRRSSEKLYGLPFHEALEMAYDNMQDMARRAVKGKRRPTAKAQAAEAARTARGGRR